MTKYLAVAVLACLLAGCTTPPPAPGTPTTVAVKKPRCDPPTGSHIVDPDSCGTDAFVKHAVITDRSGSPRETQGNPQH